MAFFIPVIIVAAAVGGVVAFVKSRPKGGTSKRFQISVDDDAKTAAMDILSASETLKWAKLVASKRGATMASDAASTLRLVIATIPGLKTTALNRFRLSQLAPPNEESWADVLDDAKGHTWGELVDIADKFIKAKGLG